MIDGKRVLAIVPARGGSKRLPDKNIRPLAGKPLIAWTLDFARQEPSIDEIIVSTDSDRIAAESEAAGVPVPWLRPAALATDTASSIDVALHALSLAKHAPDYLVLLQPTSPFRDPAMLREALSLSHAANGGPVVALGPARSHPEWCFKRDMEGHFVPLLKPNGPATRSQDLSPVFEITGALYVIGAVRLISERSFVGDDLQGVISTDRHLEIDIDDAFDWLVAEAVATTLTKG